MPRVLAALELREECKWGKPTGALLKDPKKVLIRLGEVQAGRVMKFTSVKVITAKAATIKACVREAIAVEKAGRWMGRRKISDFPVPDELTERFRTEPRFKRAFEGRGFLEKR